MISKIPLIFLLAFILFGCSTKSYYNLTTNASAVLYAGVENPFQFTGKNVRNIKLFSDKGIIQKTDSLRKDTVIFIFKSTETGKTKITIKTPGRIFEETYRIKKIPDPIVTFGGVSYKNSGTIRSDEAKKIKYLFCTLSDFDYNCSFSILKYKLVFISSEGKRIEENISGAGIPADISQKLESGSILIIKEVLIKIQNAENTFLISGPTIEVK